jgi:hypothetical protein
LPDKALADEYFAVTEKVEALYGQPNQLAGDDESREMRAAHRDAPAHPRQRLLRTTSRGGGRGIRR